ncbi:MAG: peptide chain release factor N(5)-glutamine methyltransferase [Rhodobacteraceae bacterium]|nr:peptide chain release factor N(5)-glutamine methyltransferase [Paracoccaceae bacterium]
MTGTDLLRRALPLLRQAGIDDPMRDARRLLAHALDIAPGRLTLVLPDPVPADAEARFADAIAARAARQPVSQIVGQRQFFGRNFRVTSDVLDPRPETEVLVQTALSAPFGRVLDLGTGSGCILLSLLAERPAATGLGVDISQAALHVARDNARALDLLDRAAFQVGDWAAGLSGPFDLIVCNPPYIDAAEYATLAPEPRLWEPRGALTPGPDGLAPYRVVLGQVPGLLSPGGRVVFETGAGQSADVAALAREAGFGPVQVLCDLDGRGRVVAATFG